MKTNFLIVEDDSDLGDTIKDLLEAKYEADAIAVENPLEGMVQCAQRDFDLILTDFSMPHKTGSEFISALRGGKTKNSATPVILMTGNDFDCAPDSELWENVFFLKKPFQVTQLEFLVNCTLKKQNE